MAARIIETLESATPGRFVRVYYDSDLKEYVSRLFIEHKHYEPADYFTNDKSDARQTGRFMVDEAAAKAIKHIGA